MEEIHALSPNNSDGFGLQTQLLVVKDDRYRGSIQFGLLYEQVAIYNFSKWKIVTGWGLHQFSPSAIVQGIQYRSYTGIHAKLSGAFIIPGFNSFAKAEKLYAQAGVGAYVSRYAETEYYFFYPAAEIALNYSFPFNKGGIITLSLPVSIHFKQALAVSFSLGIGGSISFLRYFLK